MQHSHSRHTLQEAFSFVQVQSTRKGSPYRERLKALLSGELDFHGQNSNHTIHSWHAFPAKFPPQLPNLFIRELTKPGEIVFDPMMGSCTTLIEAIFLGRRALGCDIDPLTLEIGGAKLQPIDVKLALITGKTIVTRAQRVYEKNTEALKRELDRQFDEDTRAFINYWFKEKTQLELISLAREIDSVLDPSLRDFFRLVLSSIVITKSGGVSLARDLAHTRPHRVEKAPNSALAEYWKRLQRNLREYSPAPSGTQYQIFEADARNLPIRENSIDLIVTSPPYASHAIDYMRAHKFSLVWFGYLVEDLSDLRRKYIGGDSIGNAELLPLPKHSEEMVRSVSRVDPRKGKVLHRYYSEMKQILREMFRVLKAGRAAVIVIGSSTMRKIDVESERCIGEIGAELGFDLVHIGVRRLDRDRRMMPARWRNNGANSIESRMHKEYVIGLLKPEGGKCT